MNYPSYFDEAIENDDIMEIIHIDRQNKKCLVKHQGKSFICTLQDWLIDGVQRGDGAKIKKSTVTGEYIVVDYTVNTITNYIIHNSYQENVEDMICDEEGVPYGN